MTRRLKNSRLEHALARLRELAPGYAFLRTESHGPVLIRIKRPPEPAKENKHE